MTENVPKRRRLDKSPSPTYRLDEQNDDYQPYVPVAQRKLAKLAALTSRGAKHPDRSRSNSTPALDDEDEEELLKRDKERKDRTLLLEAQEVHRKKAAEGKQKCRL